MRVILVAGVLALVSSCALAAGEKMGDQCADKELAERIESMNPLSRLQFSRVVDRCGETLRGAKLPRAMLAAVHHRSDLYLEKLIEQEVDLDLDLGEYYSRPLMQAIRGLDTSKVRLLIEAGAEVNFTGDTSWGSRNPTLRANTPLDRAQALNRYDMIYLLVQAGADYNRENPEGSTIIDNLSRTRMRTSGPLYEYFLKVIRLVEEREGIRLDTSDFRTYVNADRVPPGQDIPPK